MRLNPVKVKVNNMSIANHKQPKGRYKWTIEKRRHLLRMCGYFNKDEMAEIIGVNVNQIKDMVKRMGASYRVTKNKADYYEKYPSEKTDIPTT